MKSRLLFFSALLGVGALAWSGCSGGNGPTTPAATCSASNCNGCCNAQGQCVEGDTPDACGQRGEACTTCSSGLACVANACTGAMGGGDGGAPQQDGGAGADGGGTSDAGTSDAGTGGGSGSTDGGGVSDSGLAFDAGVQFDGGFRGDAGLEDGGSTGGGPALGDAGIGDGGLAARCLRLDFSTGTGLGASYTDATADGGAAVSSAYMGRQSLNFGRFDYLGTQLRYFGESANPTLPLVKDLQPTTNRACELCVVYQESCDQLGGNCARVFLAQGGAVAVVSATRNTAVGEFRAVGDQVIFEQWDNMRDAPSDGGSCVVMDFALSASWGMDGGTSEGSGGGADGGTGGGQGDAGAGGSSDAGFGVGATDAGTGDATDAGDPDGGGGRLPGMP